MDMKFPALVAFHAVLVLSVSAEDVQWYHVDLQPQANQRLDEDFPPGHYPGDNFSELKKGERQFDGVPFRIGDGLIEVAGRFVPQRPVRVDEIPVGRHVKRIYFLHGARWGAYGGQGNRLGHWVADGTPIGYYEVNYEGRETRAVPIVYGFDVRDWWSVWDNAKPTRRGRVVWKGNNPHLRTRTEARHTKTPLRLYMMTWDNPEPEAPVTSINMVSLKQTATPFCVAVTAETLRPPFAAELRDMERRIEQLRADFEKLKGGIDRGKKSDVSAGDSGYRFYDDFEGQFSRAWSIRKPNPKNISLTKRPGMLTITTEHGGIWKSFDETKNIFLVDNPIAGGGDFVMTTRLVGFDPVSNYNQAGLLCFDDSDNYLKFVLQWDSNQGGRALCSLRESRGDNIHTSYVDVKEKLDNVWLRIVKTGNRYVAAASRDGEQFWVIGEEFWGNGRPAKLGLIAKNGAPRRAPQLDASFDFFAIASDDARHSSDLRDAESSEQKTKDVPTGTPRRTHLSSIRTADSGTAAFEAPVRLASQGAAIRVESPGYASPCWADFDDDGKKDLLVGQFRDGKIRVFKNLGQGRLGRGEWIRAGGSAAEIPGVW